MVFDGTYDPTIRIECESKDAIFSAISAVLKQLPREVARRLNDIKWCVYQSGGFDAVYLQLNNRSVGEVLQAFVTVEFSKPIASGEKDGVRYQLFDSVPPSDSNAITE